MLETIVLCCDDDAMDGLIAAANACDILPATFCLSSKSPVHFDLAYPGLSSCQQSCCQWILQRC